MVMMSIPTLQGLKQRKKNCTKKYRAGRQKRQMFLKATEGVQPMRPCTFHFGWWAFWPATEFNFGGGWGFFYIVQQIGTHTL